MGQNELDNFIKDSLYNRRTPIDNDVLWQNITRKKKVDTAALFFKVFVTSLLLIVITAFFFNNTFTNITGNAGLDKDKGTYNSDSNIKDLENATTINNRIVESETVITNNSNQNFHQSVNKKTITKSSIPNAKNTTSVVNSKNNTLSKQLNSAHTIQNAVFHNQKTTDLKENKIDNPLGQTIAPIGNSYVLANEQVEKSKKFYQPVPIDNKVITVSELERKSYLLPNENSVLTLSEGRKDKIECYDYNKKKPKVTVEAYSSIDYINNQLSSVSDIDNYLQDRKRTQSQKEGYRSGLRIKYALNNGIFIKAGIEHGLVKETFNLVETTEETRILPDQLLETITTGDTTIYIYGPGPVFFTETTTWNVHNTYRTWDIPLMLGYQHGIGKLNFGVEAGATYNLSHNVEGYLLAESGTPEVITDMFKSRLYTTLTGGLFVGYNLNNKWDVSAYSSFRRPLTHINSSENMINQKLTIAGLGVSMGYTF